MLELPFTNESNDYAASLKSGWKSGITVTIDKFAKFPSYLWACKIIYGSKYGSPRICP